MTFHRVPSSKEPGNHLWVKLSSLKPGELFEFITGGSTCMRTVTRRGKAAYTILDGFRAGTSVSHFMSCDVLPLDQVQSAVVQHKLDFRV